MSQPHSGARNEPSARAHRGMTFSAEEIEVRYGSRGPSALTDVSVTIPRGDLYAVLGPNGSGKSTLMRTLLGVIRPLRGTARVDGRAVGEWSRRDLARSVGVVTQREPRAFPMTVWELVEMGRYPHLGPLRPLGDADRAIIRDALTRCDVSELGDRLVDTLSGGELQRVRIARALAQEPRALALDEPTSSLDIRHEMTILRLLRHLADRGTTVLLITHNLNMAARFADRILLLDGGRTVAEGTVTEVIRADVLERVYRWPVSVAEDPVTGAPLVTPLT
ncbi:MAG: ABC transporter ATP-binding protein [Longimicrobiales bacterium]|nr:ABC transporter ATP-binding protein [Longimicrobiales bacterium]